VIAAERKLAECREQQRALERQAQEATFSQRSLQARRGELSRTIETAAQQARALADEQQRARDEQSRLSDAAAKGGLRTRWP
jgi:chromosome segregation protein